MAGRLGVRTAEALVEGDLDYLCAEPEIVLGELDGRSVQRSPPWLAVNRLATPKCLLS